LLKKELLSLALYLQEQIQDEDIMKIVFFERDIENRELINIVANLGMVQLFSSSLMSKIVIDIWEGPYSINETCLKF